MYQLPTSLCRPRDTALLDDSAGMAGQTAADACPRTAGTLLTPGLWRAAAPAPSRPLPSSSSSVSLPAAAAAAAAASWLPPCPRCCRILKMGEVLANWSLQRIKIQSRAKEVRAQQADQIRSGQVRSRHGTARQRPREQAAKWASKAGQSSRRAGGQGCRQERPHPARAGHLSRRLLMRVASPRRGW